MNAFDKPMLIEPILFGKGWAIGPDPLCLSKPRIRISVELPGGGHQMVNCPPDLIDVLFAGVAMRKVSKLCGIKLYKVIIPKEEVG